MLLFIVALEILCVGAVGSLLFQKDRALAYMICSIASIIGSALVLVFALQTLIMKLSYSFVLYTGFPLLNLSVHIDALSAFFLLVVSLIAIPASLYGIGYMKQYVKEYNIGLFGFFYALFLLSLYLVVTAYNGLYFLFVWEIMSLSSFFLVLFEHKRAETVQAGKVYLIMTHVGAGFLALAFLLLYQVSGSFDFAVIKLHSPQIPFILRTIILVSLLIGFGTKAGVIPLHIWLPRAHGSAPSHVSALMSGVMIKMGIFMLFRMFLDVLPQPTVWLGFVVLLLGATSSVLGVLYALSEHDIKRLLAYHSIENIGIILLGLGSGLIFVQLHQPVLAMLAVVAGLFHTLNHAIFKSLLFFSAGSVISKTHTRNIEEYGGLIKVMPYTALFFLVGAIAISGLPPFNGFVSEWLTFQSIFAGVAMKSMLFKSVFIIAGASLAFTGGLAAACFVKAFGITFLARPRSKESEKAKEVSPVFTASMGFLAILCLLLGVFGAQVTVVLRGIAGSLAGLWSQAGIFTQMTNVVVVPQGSATLNMQMLVFGLLGGIAVTFGVSYFFSHKQKIVAQDIWSCGFTELTPRMEITATGFSRSLILIFRGIFRPTKQSEEEYIDANMRYFSKSHTVTLNIVNIYEKHLYEPLHAGIVVVSKRIKSFQGGNINQYLLYVFLLLIALLIWARYTN
jgi:hydrogenase-4 component B